MSVEADQRAVCQRHGVAFHPPSTFEKVGIALSTLHLEPLNGLRLRPEGGTCGWYIWGGSEMSSASDFFEPLHVHHLAARCPAVLAYLALPPGSRFLIAADNEDVWDDPSLLRAGAV
jgi:hypothetical protein